MQRNSEGFRDGHEGECRGLKEGRSEGCRGFQGRTSRGTQRVTGKDAQRDAVDYRDGIAEEYATNNCLQVNPFEASGSKAKRLVQEQCLRLLTIQV